MKDYNTIMQKYIYLFIKYINIKYIYFYIFIKCINIFIKSKNYHRQKENLWKSRAEEFRKRN